MTVSNRYSKTLLTPSIFLLSLLPLVVAIIVGEITRSIVMKSGLSCGIKVCLGVLVSVELISGFVFFLVLSYEKKHSSGSKITIKNKKIDRKDGIGFVLQVLIPLFVFDFGNIVSFAQFFVILAFLVVVSFNSRFFVNGFFLEMIGFRQHTCVCENNAEVIVFSRIKIEEGCKYRTAMISNDAFIVLSEMPR